MKNVNSNGLVLWEGPSQLDGEPIALILTGISNWTANRKTGAMYQTWILRSDMHPQEAIVHAHDKSICGACPLRRNEEKKRLCYVLPVTLGQIYKQYAADRYQRKDVSKLTHLQLGARFGSYGDPCAIPIQIWKDLLEKVPFHTGYTRQWLNPEFKEYQDFLMASCFSNFEQALASEKGWNTYRIREVNGPKLESEIVCPASKESSILTSCQQCKLCKGNKGAKNIVVTIHGNNLKHYRETAIPSKDITPEKVEAFPQFSTIEI